MIHLSVILMLTGIVLGCKAEEVQTTVWEGDEPISTDSLLEGASDSDLSYVQLTEETYIDDRGKRQTRGNNSEEHVEYMLFANRQFLVQMFLNATIRNVFQLTAGSNAIACDYDVREGQMFWSDVAHQVIARTGINDGTGTTVLINRQYLTVPDGIAWDWTTRKVYWTDADERDVEVIDPNSGNRTVLFRNDQGSIPRAIVLDPTTRMMYWTDWGTLPMIERASMDGTSRSVIVRTDLGWPNGLTIDYVSQTLYWVDALLDKIEKSNVDGSLRMLLPTPASVVQHPFGITFFRGNIYWSDWETNSLYTAPVTNTTFGIRRFYGGLTFDPMQLHIVDGTRQPFVNNPCQLNNGGCSHLCLLSSTSISRYSCACNEGMILSSDNRTCIETPSAPTTPSTSLLCVPTCNNGGQCVNGQCVCPSGWEGTQCSDPICIPQCMNGGVCIAPNNCTCPREYKGDRCEIPICFPPDGCRNGGVCVRPGHCSCSIEWEGVRCDEPICSPSCGSHGSCISPDQCLCDAGWEGALCSQAICYPPDGCRNDGYCVFPGQCSCRNGWRGAKCDEAICWNDCHQHGVCLAPNVCYCEPLWTGPFCSQALCFPECENGGICVIPGVCACLPGTRGHRCEIKDDDPE